MLLNLFYILIFSSFLRLIFVVGTFGSSDDYVHNYMFKNRKIKKNPFTYTPINSIIVGVQGYPQLFHYIVSLFPEENWHSIARLGNIILDCLIIIISFFLSLLFFNADSINYEGVIPIYSYVALLLSTSPLLIPATARIRAMGARVFGYFLFFFLLVFVFFLLTDWTIVGAIGFTITFFLIIISSQFAMQISIWTGLILSISYLNPLPVVLLIATFLLAWKSNHLGTHDILSAKIAHWRWYFRNSQVFSPIIGRNSLNDHLWLPLWLIKNPRKAISFIFRNSVPIILLYSALPLVLLIWIFSADSWLLENVLSQPQTRFLFWVSVAAATACFLTSLKPLLFLGEAERYIEYAMPAIAILYVYAVAATERYETWLLYVVFFQLIGILSNFLYITKNDISSKLQNKIHPSFRELIDFLKEQKPMKIIAIPTKIAFSLGAMINEKHHYYYSFINGPSKDYAYMKEDHIAYDLIRPDFDHFKTQYGVNTVVLSKETKINAEKNNIYYDISKYPTIFENDDFVVIKV